MALQDIGTEGQGEAIRLAKIEVGAQVSGYISGFVDSKKQPPPMRSGQSIVKKDILMVGEDGTPFRVFTAGNVMYKVADGALREGLFTVFTRLPDKKNKDGNAKTDFRIQQDPERTLALAQTTAKVASTTTSDKASIREQAAKIAAAVKGK
jgi:hypothetical protein